AESGFVALQPTERSDRAGCKDESVGEPTPGACQPASQLRRDRHAARVVIRERRMAYVSEQQDFFPRGTRNNTLAVCKRPAGEMAIHSHAIKPVAPFAQVALSNT